MIHDYGDRALLLDLDGTADVLAWCDAVREADLPGVVDVVPAARTVLLVLAGPRHQAPTRARLGGLQVERSEVTPADRRSDVTIDVVYDGEDLDEVARLTGLSPDDVVAAHTAAPMRVGFGGFSPGFAYLVGGDERLHVPRRAEPRTKVPGGSVGLAGEFSGVYPRETPGGWQLIGHTDAVLWDVDRDPPALLIPGTWVQFRAVAGGPR
jgi:KipI family sensor histidine kinase inhibitor